MAELILFESAAGYGLLEVVSWEDAAADQAADSLPRFSRAMKLKAIHPFANAMEALENANAISEHAMTETLSNFLEMNVKRGKKGTTLGVIDPALATAIAEGTGISCRSDERVREVIRGCRMHWDHFSKTSNHDKAQLGLGHAYSRSKVKFNPARADNMIIQSIALLDTLDKDVNTFAMRVREWYSWHFPELKQLVKDNVQYARVAAYVGDRTTLSGGGTADKLPGLAALLNDDETLAEQIIVASKHSMGVDCNETDMLNICNFTTRMVQLATYRHKLSLYLHDKMTTVAPNLSALIGDTVAARLISKAGSLTSLAKAPASTVQILGAEKALFRALKTKGNTPKYGLIYHSTFIGRAEAKNKGRISRYLANKCSMAVRIDSFSDTPTSAYGVQLRNQVEERLKFYETGAAPKRNIDVMEAVAKELKMARGNDTMDVDDEDEDDEAEKTSSSKKSKKKKSKDKDDAAAAATPAPKRKAEEASDDDDEEEDKKAAKKSAKKAKKEKKKSKKSKKSIE